MELFRLLGTIAVDNEQANKAIADTASNAEEGSNKTSEAFQKIGQVAGTIVKGIAVAGVALGGAWIAAIEGSREYRTEMGKLDTAFQVAGHSSEAAKQTYSDLNAVLGDSGQATEAAQHLALLADNEKELQTWTNICTGVYATFGESLPIEGLAEAANVKLWHITSSPVLTPSIMSARCKAAVPEERATTCLFSPIYCSKSASKPLTLGPRGTTQLVSKASFIKSCSRPDI